MNEWNILIVIEKEKIGEIGEIEFFIGTSCIIKKEIELLQKMQQLFLYEDD